MKVIYLLEYFKIQLFKQQPKYLILTSLKLCFFTATHNLKLVKA